MILQEKTTRHLHFQAGLMNKAGYTLGARPMLGRFGAAFFILLLFSDIIHASEDTSKMFALELIKMDNNTIPHMRNKAQLGAISTPNNESQRLFINNTSLTAGALFHAYMSSDSAQRRLSEMYILGVIDSSEGIYWCGYEIASPAAIQEQIYAGLKKASADAPNERAATAIKSHFNKILPCKEEQ